jgi:hypothetical protein
MKPATTMVSLVEDYLAYRRRLGFALESDERRLLCFARFADQVGHRGPITEELALRWASSSGRTTATTRAGRLTILSPFAKYRRQFDPATEVAPPGLCGPGPRRLTPHIYSEEEIEALLVTARQLPPAGGLGGRDFLRMVFALVHVETNLLVGNAGSRHELTAFYLSFDQPILKPRRPGAAGGSSSPAATPPPTPHHRPKQSSTTGQDNCRRPPAACLFGSGL